MPHARAAQALAPREGAKVKDEHRTPAVLAPGRGRSNIERPTSNEKQKKQNIFHEDHEDKKTFEP